MFDKFKFITILTNGLKPFILSSASFFFSATARVVIYIWCTFVCVPPLHRYIRTACHQFKTDEIRALTHAPAIQLHTHTHTAPNVNGWKYFVCMPKKYQSCRPQIQMNRRFVFFIICPALSFALDSNGTIGINNEFSEDWLNDEKNQRFEYRGRHT